VATVGVALEVTSDLKGMVSNLPYPLAKNSQQSGSFKIETVFPRSLGVPLGLQYNGQLNAVFDLDEHMTLQRGAVTFGGMVPLMPEKALISLEGKLEHLSLDEWLPFVSAAEGSDANVSESSDAAVVEIEQLNLEIAALSAFGYDFHYASVGLARALGSWQGAVNSHLMGGRVQIPLDFARNTLEMELDYLILPGLVEAETVADAGGAEEEIDPRELPAMDINSRFFSYADESYGQLQLLTTRSQHGLHVARLNLNPPWMALSASGEWTMVNHKQHSSFDISADSENFGEMLTRLDIADSVRDGESSIRIAARWPGTPMAFALEHLSGSMQLKVEDGRLLDIKPGAGRLFGLISVQALKRRLTLDFSDMFKKGFSFNRMEGGFEIHEGNATTSDFNIVGPSASIAMVGRVGLAAKDYDQYVIVEPHMASSLPVVGALVSSLGTGVVIWAAQKLLNLGEPAQVEYRVTGPWDAPMVLRRDEMVPAGTEEQ